MTGVIASAAKVFDTAISVTEARSRRASLQARPISASTAASPFGEWSVSGAALASVMMSIGAGCCGASSNFTEFKKEFLNPLLYLSRGVGSEDGKRQFQPQTSETQAGSRNPGAACVARGDSGDAFDVRAHPLARRHAHAADRAGHHRIHHRCKAQRRCAA